ncbi:phage major capsid protein, P2 family [Photorhabdus tasmaniensis]|uniref:Phage major capsid protein, P2 family n=1 Tax=Photorhabdus tasmaniensis TaxID=1004159 RepID=A0ABX0GFB9_9GAMM|nr:phage major capsid protein, P2 family [Photorhabdus tasmaniensis]NHB87180.1 phage major capsid protein, P2 family [Photorhabdus tasmaniensis]
MRLTPKAEALLRKYTAGLAKTSHVDSTARFFSLTEPHEIQFRDALLQESTFLGLITVMDVEQISGSVIATGNPGLFTGRKKGGRFMREMGPTGNDYKLVETDSGSFLPYDTLVTWANAGSENEFFERIQSFSTESFALDMLRVGFNGTLIAEDTDPEKYPSGEDVNIGWHQIVKVRSPGQIVTDKVVLDRVGTGADFVSIDAVATDLIHTLIPEQFRQDPRLVVLVSADLIGADTTSMMNRIDRPTEKVAAQLINREIAGRKAYSPPFMPEGRIIVTTLKNLHLYTQARTRQRRSDWIDDRKQFENNYLRMEGYAVEYDELYASIDKVTIGDGLIKEPEKSLTENELAAIESQANTDLG